MLRDARVVLTGGAGFLGSHLADRLAANNEVVVLDDLSAGREGAWQPPPNVAFVRGSVTDPETLGAALREASHVLHLAARVSVAESLANPTLYRRVNAEGTLNVLAAGARRGVERVVFASSAAVYGDRPAVPTREDHPLRPRSPYAATKMELSLIHV